MCKHGCLLCILLKVIHDDQAKSVLHRRGLDTDAQRISEDDAKTLLQGIEQLLLVESRNAFSAQKGHVSPKQGTVMMSGDLAAAAHQAVPSYMIKHASHSRNSIDVLAATNMHLSQDLHTGTMRSLNGLIVM